MSLAAFALVATPLLALLGVLLGHRLTRTSALELDRWRKREETMRLLRWGVEIAIDPVDPGRARVGIRVLDALATAPLVDRDDEDLVNAVTDAAARMSRAAAARAPAGAIVACQTVGPKKGCSMKFVESADSIAFRTEAARIVMKIDRRRGRPSDPFIVNLVENGEQMEREAREREEAEDSTEAARKRPRGRRHGRRRPGAPMPGRPSRHGSHSSMTFVESADSIAFRTEAARVNMKINRRLGRPCDPFIVNLVENGEQMEREAREREDAEDSD